MGELGAAAPYAAALQEAADREVARWVEQARALLETSGTLAEFSERLLDIYPLLSATALAALVGDATAAAHLAGRYDVQEGD